MENKRLNEFQIQWNGRLLWVDVYKDFYRVSLPDGRDIRMWKTKEGWKGLPDLVINDELGRLIDEQELKKG